VWLCEYPGLSFQLLSGTRLLACLIVAPQRGYDEPGILSYAISSFCPTSADGLQRAYSKLAGGFLGLIAKTLKIGDRYVDKHHIRKISIHRHRQRSLKVWSKKSPFRRFKKPRPHRGFTATAPFSSNSKG
jgi:hypothetical protein